MKRSLLVKLIVLVAVSIALAGGALLARNRGNRKRATTSWRSLEQPAGNTATEEYAVYSAILDQLHAEKRLRVFVIRDHTLTCGRLVEWCDQTAIKARSPQLETETFDDYLVQNQTSVSLGKFSTLTLPVDTLSDAELRKMFVRTNRAIDLAAVPSRKIYWGSFYERYGLSPGLVSFSQVGFNSKMDQALVYEEIQATGDGTWGRYLLLSRLADVRSADYPHPWLIRDKVEKWMPEDPAPSIRNNELGTIKGLVLDAREEGLDQAEINSLICGWDIGSLQVALNRDSLIVAELIDKKTIATPYDLVTWYKFRIVEKLAEKPPPKYLTDWETQGPPQELQPVTENEFVIAETNGEMEIDGVRVIQHSNGAVYAEGKMYLMFLHINPAKRLAIRTGTDPLGIFLIDKDGTFTSYIDRTYPLREQMAKRFGNSIEKLRRVLKN